MAIYGNNKIQCLSFVKCQVRQKTICKNLAGSSVMLDCLSAMIRSQQIQSFKSIATAIDRLSEGTTPINAWLSMKRAVAQIFF